jgi:hypothetical protein
MMLLDRGLAVEIARPGVIFPLPPDLFHTSALRIF